MLVETLWSGISSGTEMLAYRGEIGSDVPLDETIDALGGTFSYPFAYGYACVGRVASSDAAVTEGDVVFAFHPHQDRFVVPASDVFALPGIDPRIATLFPLVETALQVFLDVGPVQEEQVVVMGLGVVGMLVAILLERNGARVICSEPNEWRREVARSLDLAAVGPARLRETVERRTEGRGVPVVVDSGGDPAALGPALGLLAPEGTLLVASWFGSKVVPLPLGREFHRRRLSLRSSQVSSIPAALAPRWSIARRRARAVSLLDELPLKVLATHEFAFEDAPAAFAALDRGESGLLHAALRYDAAG